MRFEVVSSPCTTAHSSCMNCNTSGKSVAASLGCAPVGVVAMYFEFKTISDATLARGGRRTPLERPTGQRAFSFGLCPSRFDSHPTALGGLSLATRRRQAGLDGLFEDPVQFGTDENRESRHVEPKE